MLLNKHKSKGKRTRPLEVITLANNPPTTAIAAFADGSALGNPGRGVSPPPP